MLRLIFFITAFAAVISDDLLEVSYNIDENYFDHFSEKQCVNTTQWYLVNYGDLEIVPPYDGRLSISASRNSCATSFPIVFFNGTVEVTVYLRTISKYSGLTISVFDERDDALVSVRYQRSNNNFVPGWAVVMVPIQKHTTGYVQFSGQSLNSELILIDSLRYIPDNSTYIQVEENTQSDHNPVTNTLTINAEVTNEPREHIFHNNERVLEISDDDIDGSGDSGTEPSVTAEEDSDEDEDTNEEEDPGENEDTNEEEDPEEGTENSDPGGGFWNVFTITFVAVGAFTVVGLVGVGSYFVGKNRGVSQNPPLDVEAIETPREIIPRARSVFSDTTPYDRFSRYS